MRISLPSGTPAEVARPENGRPPSRGLVVIPDIMGLRPLFDDHVARLAREHGWAVIAIEPWPGREDLSLDARLDAVGTIADADLLADAQAAADVLDVEPVAVLGFCMGGMFAMKAAATGRFDRAVPFYGMIRVPDRWANGDGVEPLDAVASASCSVLGVFGGIDSWTPPADVDALEAAGAEVLRYPEADHGFVHDPSRPAHRADDAEDAWRRVIEFLER